MNSEIIATDVSQMAIICAELTRMNIIFKAYQSCNRDGNNDTVWVIECIGY